MANHINSYSRAHCSILYNIYYLNKKQRQSLSLKCSETRLRPLQSGPLVRNRKGVS